MELVELKKKIFKKNFTSNHMLITLLIEQKWPFVHLEVIWKLP